MNIDHAACTRCGLCVRVCLKGLITDGPMVQPEAAVHCLGCGHCVAVCPRGAVRLDDGPLPEAGDGLLGLLQMRRSGRHYHDMPVAREHLEALLAAAATAPSAKNFRPVTAIVLTDPAVIAEVRARTLDYYRRLLRLLALPGFPLLLRLKGYTPAQQQALAVSFTRLTAPDAPRDTLFHHAPALLLFTAPRHWAQGVGDAWLAAHTAALYAETIPVATCYNGYLVQAAGADRAVRRALTLPDGHRLVVAVTLGYPAISYARPAPRPPLPAVWR